MAEHELTAASTWFKRAIQEAKTYDNETHAANVHAHLGRVAWATGNLDSAVEQLNAAYQTVTASGVVHLQIQIELWLAELHLDRNESSLAEEWLDIARRKLADSERQALRKREQQITHRLKDASLL